MTLQNWVPFKQIDSDYRCPDCHSSELAWVPVLIDLDARGIPVCAVYPEEYDVPIYECQACAKQFDEPAIVVTATRVLLEGCE